MDTRLYITEHDVRRLKSIFRTSENIYMRLTNNEALFIADKVSFFKSLSIKATSDTRVSLKVSPDVMANLSRPGVIDIKHTGDRVQFGFSLTEDDSNAGRYRWVTTINYSNIEDFLLRDYIRAINSVEVTHFGIPSLDNLKEIVNICTACEVGIQISDGYIYSSGENLKMFHKINDSEMQLALDLSSLKELSRFGTDGNIHHAGEYFLVSRDKYTLGIRKVRLTEIGYPEEFYNCSTALSAYYARFGDSVELLKVHDKKLDKIRRSTFRINFDNNTIAVDNGRTNYLVSLLCKNIYNPEQVKNVTMDLSSIKYLYKLLSDSEVVGIYIYPRIVKIEFPSGMNVLLRGEINS